MSQHVVQMFWDYWSFSSSTINQSRSFCEPYQFWFAKLLDFWYIFCIFILLIYQNNHIKWSKHISMFPLATFSPLLASQNTFILTHGIFLSSYVHLWLQDSCTGKATAHPVFNRPGVTCFSLPPISNPFPEKFDEHFLRHIYLHVWAFSFPASA